MIYIKKLLPYFTVLTIIAITLCIVNVGADYEKAIVKHDTITEESTLYSAENEFSMLVSADESADSTELSTEPSTQETPKPVIPQKPIQPETSIESTPKEEIETSIQPVPEEKPDIITDLDIIYYNNQEEGFNMIDGREYIEDIAKYLDKYAPAGMLKSVGCAMAYTEGGAGKQGVYACSNNCFGIMATSEWEGMVYSRTTGKVYKDYSTAKQYGASGLFRAYDSMEDSVKDYVRLISGEYYGDVLKITNHREYIQYILNKGYGEEFLVDMWMSLISMYDLKQYD